MEKDIDMENKTAGMPEETGEVSQIAAEEETVENAGVDTAAQEKKNSYPTQVALGIRAVVGAYVIYLAYQLFTSKNEMTPVMWAAAVLFIVAGTALIGFSIKHYVCGEYEGGRRDKDEP